MIHLRTTEKGFCARAERLSSTLNKTKNSGDNQGAELGRGLVDRKRLSQRVILVNLT